MILLHKMNGDVFILNSHHIETIEARPDTVITLTNDRKYLVLEPVDELLAKVVEYQRMVLRGKDTDPKP
jgi:flagellar protein FlbD